MGRKPDVEKAAKIWHAARALSEQTYSRVDQYLQRAVMRLLKWERAGRKAVASKVRRDKE